PDLDIRMADELGIDADFIEAAAYAVLGEACLRSESLATSTRSVRGTRRVAVLGRIIQPPRGRAA
ncbi:MAG TPA: anhydro-N-acetylmuramic acid kinase, partial [Candidatus Deferrimicrobium sp.]|nr:anhydro-N-acetylmuramic acid kinase [Candidatus Deferrimicrobium sp.]